MQLKEENTIKAQAIEHCANNGEIMSQIQEMHEEIKCKTWMQSHIQCQWMKAYTYM